MSGWNVESDDHHIQNLALYQENLDLALFQRPIVLHRQIELLTV